MTVTMIDRAAHAMYATVQPEWTWEEPDAELLRQMYRDNARPAILPIRNPSPAMESAGYDELQRSESISQTWCGSVPKAGHRQISCTPLY